MRTIRKGAATYVKHEPTGRVGIIPNILPVAATPDCSGEAPNGEACLLGSPEDWSLVLTTGDGDAPVGAGAIERGADVSVKVSLVGRNFVRTGTVATDISLSSGTRGETILSAPAELTVSGTPPDPAEGVELAWTILVADDPDRCDVTHPDRFNEQTVVVTASDALTGAIPAYAAGEGPSAGFTINCPDSPGRTARRQAWARHLCPRTRSRWTSRRIDGAWWAAFGPAHPVFSTPPPNRWKQTASRSDIGTGTAFRLSL